MAPGKPADRKYQELVEILGKHFNPAPLLIAERFHFHNRNQNEGEGVADYEAVLKKYAERCQFDSFLEQALRDRFVCGLRNRAIQKKALDGERFDVENGRRHNKCHGISRQTS